MVESLTMDMLGLSTTFDVQVSPVASRNIPQIHDPRRIDYDDQASEERQAASSRALLADALQKLDRAGSHADVEQEMERLVRIAPDVRSALLERVRIPQDPDRSSLFEYLLFASLDPRRALQLGMAPRIKDFDFEACAWIGVYTRFLQSDRVKDDSIRIRLVDALIEKSKNHDVSVRVAAIEGLGCVLDTVDHARERLSEIALSDPDPFVAEEARMALDAD